MCAGTNRFGDALGEVSRTRRHAGHGTMAEAKDVSTELLREFGALQDPDTNPETAEEVAMLANFLVAYSCVPGASGRHGEPPVTQSSGNQPRTTS